jgi:hypothetical protein
MMRRLLFAAIGLVLIAWTCPFDDTLRAYLSRHFWMPFAKHPGSFERPNVRRVSAPFAGMVKEEAQTPLQRLRAMYQQISRPEWGQHAFNAPFAKYREVLAAAQADTSLSARDREEVALLDAKIDMREGLPEAPAMLERAKDKLQKFLKTARTPEFLSEARGWLAHIHYVLGDQTAAGKIYLDELNRNGSNLSRETLLNSLRMTYGYNGGNKLRDHLGEYFDTPEHAAFAIQLVTNPNSGGDPSAAATYAKLKGLLDKHASLLRSGRGANAMALLSMRAALRLGDPAQARKIAEQVPEDAAVRADPDFQWMHASSIFLTRDYAAAEPPLLSMFRSKRASTRQKAAAAYALCGVYAKTGNALEQLRYALWLRDASKREQGYLGEISDMSLYLAVSGWDLNLILEFGAPIEVLQKFIEETKAEDKSLDLKIVKYALAVRLARVNRYEESADIYQSIGVPHRAARMRRLATLYNESAKPDLSDSERFEAKYKLAAYLASNSVRLYFNDSLWDGLQAYAFQAETDSRLSGAERESLLAAERQLKDDQEEYWRAYLLLREIVREAGPTSEVAKRSARLAIQSVRRISSRFGRADEIRNADIQLSKWLRNPATPL